MSTGLIRGAVARLLPGRRSAEALSGPGPRIAVIGNCQAEGVALSVATLLPGAQVRLFGLAGLRARRGGLETLVGELRAFDHVFVQALEPGSLPGSGPQALCAALPAARLYPSIVFSAFHPDAIYVGAAGGRLVPSPLHTYHSAIVLFGFLRGLTPGRVAALFRRDVMVRLGYFAAWDSCASDLVRASRAVGFDLSGEIARWARRGVFMRNINHPSIGVLGEVAARLLREAGFQPADIDVGDYVPDPLLDGVVWPVYPPIAEFYGVAGSTLFKGRRPSGGMAPSYDLGRLIAESFALYETTARAQLRCHRTDLWDGIPEIRALFDGGA